MESINKGVRSEKGCTIVICNTRIANVIEPRSINIKQKYWKIAHKTINKCGIRRMITYYPIPPGIAKNRRMVPYFLVCLARCREEKLQKLRGEAKSITPRMNPGACNGGSNASID